MRIVAVEIFITVCFFLERVGLIRILVSKIQPDKKTLKAFSLLKKIYLKAEKLSIKLWVTGSWAVTGRFGSYFKNIGDIDFTLQTMADEDKFSSLLCSMGITSIGKCNLVAHRHLDRQSGVSVDFGAVERAGIFCSVPLLENETISILGFNCRVLSAREHLKIYKCLLFSRGRNIKHDMSKIKILSSCLKN